MRFARPRSLFAKIVLAQIAILAMLAVSLPLLLSHLLHQTADDYVSARLRDDARTIAASLEPGGQTFRQTIAPKLGPMYDRDGGNKAFGVFGQNGTLIAHGPRPIVTPPRLQSIRSGQFFPIGDYDVFALRKNSGGQGALILVEQNRKDPEVLVDDVVSDFLGRLLWIIPIVLILFFLAGALAIRQTTLQVQRIAKAADQIEPHRLDIRLDEATGPSELAPLVGAANRALDRLEAGFREQNEFVANVAHELRTPLAVVALRAEAIDDSAVRESILAGITRTSHVVGQLMELASVENSAPEFLPVDLASVARDIIMDHAPLAYRNGKTIELIGENTAGAGIVGNAGLIGIVLSNLIDNAVRHTPPGTGIKVEIEPGGAVSVIDDGPGIQTSDAALVRQRYWRADHRRADGAGLGLAISDRIMALHGGSMEVAETRGKGAHFRLKFGKV